MNRVVVQEPFRRRQSAAPLALSVSWLALLHHLDSSNSRIISVHRASLSISFFQMLQPMSSTALTKHEAVVHVTPNPGSLMHRM